MNIYILIEDGDSFCIRAKTMSEAVAICEKSYLDEAMDDENYDEQREKEYYHEQILQSCSLVGELKN